MGSGAGASIYLVRLDSEVCQGKGRGASIDTVRLDMGGVEIASIDTVRLDMGRAESKHCYSEVRQGWGREQA